MLWDVARFFLIAAAALVVAGIPIGAFVYFSIVRADRRRKADRAEESRLRIHLLASP